MKTRLILSNAATLIVGGLLGAGFALLYAPQSGRTTRAMIRTKGVMLQERVSEEVKLSRMQAKEKLEQLASEAHAMAAEFGNSLKETVSSIALPLQSRRRR